MDFKNLINEILSEVEKPGMKLVGNVKVSNELQYHI